MLCNNYHTPPAFFWYSLCAHVEVKSINPYVHLQDKYVLSDFYEQNKVHLAKQSPKSKKNCCDSSMDNGIGGLNLYVGLSPYLKTEVWHLTARVLQLMFCAPFFFFFFPCKWNFGINGTLAHYFFEISVSLSMFWMATFSSFHFYWLEISWPWIQEETDCRHCQFCCGLFNNGKRKEDKRINESEVPNYWNI